jgi:hypothetical protein
MGEACSTHRGGIHTGFWLESLKDKNRFEDLGIDGKIILK